MTRRVQRLWRRLRSCSRGEHRDVLVVQPYVRVEERDAGGAPAPLWHHLFWRCVDCGAAWGLGHTSPGLAVHQRSASRSALDDARRD